jgi:hypothetical protein
MRKQSQEITKDALKYNIDKLRYLLYILTMAMEIENTRICRELCLLDINFVMYL